MAFGINRYIVRLLIPDLYREFKSPTKALEYLRSVGLGYRRKEFLADWREILGIQKVKEWWKYTPKKYLPTEDEIVTTQLKLRTQYLYTARVTYVTRQGDIESRYVSAGYDYLVAWGTAREEIELRTSIYNVDRVLEVEFEPVLKRAE